MPTNKKSLTICMPALNEATRISKTLTEVYGAAKEILDEFEIIVVDDGSTDNTSEVVLSLAKKLGPEIKVIKMDKNRGLGNAFQVVLDKASFFYICGIGADSAFPTQSIKKLFSSIGMAPIILGCRTNLRDRPMLRFILSKTITIFVSFLCGEKLRDTQGLYVLPVVDVRSLQIKLSKYNALMEILTHLLSKKINYCEIDVKYATDADKHSCMLRFVVLKSVLFSVFKLFILKITGKL